MRSLTLAVLLVPAALHAQITIGPADMPSAGDTVRYRTTAAMGLDPEPTGEGYTWDFGMLTPDVEAADTCVAVGSTPLAYQLFFNNPFLYPQHRADYAVRGQGFNFQVLNVTNVFDYYKRDSTGFRNVGFGANVNNVPTSTRRIPVDWVHRFPMEYGDMDSSSSAFTVSIPSMLSFTQHQDRYNEVDGWGTLYLPADTFEVLRVKSILHRSDSAYVLQFSQSFTFDEPETIEYKWIAQGMDMPVLQITTVSGQPAAARFHYAPEDITTGSPSGGRARLALWPNPAGGEAWLQLPEGAGRTAEVRDAQGRLIRLEPLALGPVARLDLAGLAPGAYAIRVHGAPGIAAARLLVR